MTFLDGRLPDRFWDKCMPEPNSGCWLWHGATHSGGYGMMIVGRRATYAHRLSYEALVGAIPDGLVIDHLCRQRCCVNPTHLEPVTQFINNRRGVSPIAANMNRTECVNGHELVGDNVKIRVLKNGNRTRMCVACILTRSRSRYLRVGVR
jgi:hypothetical protein